MLKRVAAASAGLALVGVLSACSGSDGAGGATPSESAAPESSAAAGPEVSDPRDASAAPPCSLLPAQAATSLGLKPQGEVEEGMEGPSCEWESPGGGSNKVSFTVLNDRSIQVYLGNRQQYPFFAELEIAGHPVVEANSVDPKTGTFCYLFVASKQGQVVQASTAIGSDKVGKINACEPGKKALEKAVPTWPSAQ